MPAFLASILPLLIRLGGGFGAQQLARIGGKRLADAALPAATGKLGATATPFVQKAGSVLSSSPGQLGAFFAGDVATGAILDRLLGGEQPQSNEDSLTRLLGSSSGLDDLTDFDRQVQERQLRGTLRQALEQSGVDLNRLQGVL